MAIFVEYLGTQYLPNLWYRHKDTRVFQATQSEVQLLKPKNLGSPKSKEDYSAHFCPPNYHQHKNNNTYIAFQPDVGLFIWKQECNPHPPAPSPEEVQMYLTVFKKKTQERGHGMHSPEEFPILWIVEAHQEAMRLGSLSKIDTERERAST